MNRVGTDNQTWKAALAYLRAGLSLIPVSTDGSKSPSGLDLPYKTDDQGEVVLNGRGHPQRTWDVYKDRVPTEEELRSWFDREHPAGIGVVGGRVSGNLETIDFDRQADALFPQWCQLVEAECPGLLERLCVVKTPRPGYHVRYRCPMVVIPGNLKLAVDPSRPRGEQNLIETRGEGGYALAPGSPADCHETGRAYDYVSGPKLSQIQAITPEEREVLIRCGSSFTREANGRRGPNGPSARGLSPGDDFDRRGPSWDKILEPAGWVAARQVGAVIYWRRPGKDHGWSATTGACTGRDGADLLCVFSSNADPFPGPSNGRVCSSHGKFAAYTLLRHRGDYKAAAEDLARQGYGFQRKADPSANGHPDSPPEPAPEPLRWPDPLPIPSNLPPVQPFDLDALLPKCFRDYIADVADRMQCPPDFPAVALMVVLAGVAGTNVSIRPKRADDWTVTPNLWGAVCGRPGVLKTPAIRVPLKFLQRLEAEAGARHKRAEAAYELEMEVFQARKKQRKEAIAKAAKSKKDAAEVARNFNLGEEPEPPKPGRYLANDCTVEALGQLLNANERGLTLFRDELVGLFRSLEREGQEGARAFYLEAWDGGGTFTYDRVARGTVHIPNVTLSLLGGITPGKLLDYLRAHSSRARTTTASCSVFNFWSTPTSAASGSTSIAGRRPRPGNASGR
jgi:hypothetical protein